MSTLKNLYSHNGKGTTVGQYLKNSAPATLGDGIESGDHLQSLVKKSQYYIPPIDYSDPKNFVKFGSAFEYYKNAFEYIPSFYPYDGSGLEKTNFFNDLNPLEKYVLEVQYPRATGFVTIGAASSSLPVSNSSGYFAAGGSDTAEYIQVKGGPHLNTVYDSTNNKGSNLTFASLSGSTVEFMLQKNNLIDSNKESQRQVIFDLTNGQTDASEGDYGRLRIELLSGSETQFEVTMMSGTVGFDKVLVPTTSDTITISDGKWRNYSFVFNTSGSQNIDFYVNGTCIETAIPANSASSAVSEVTGTLIGNIGGLRTNIRGTSGLAEGAGKLSASLDEFRFWKSARSAEEIGRYWFTNIDGVSDTSTANTSLGVYYKFNEGITTTGSVNEIVLDYSGRMSNGAFSGYNSSYSRNTGSAINQLGLTSVSERGDPIIRTSNENYVSKKYSLELSGTHYDSGNNARLLNHLPAWVIEEEEQGQNEIINITQILASYFDTLHNQISSLKELKYNRYISGSLTNSIDEFPHNDRLIENMGIVAPDLFQDIGALQHFFKRDEQINFDQQIVDIKNSIYKNIYNNLTFILKSKGNEKAIRNYIRCLGVGEEILSLNTYSDNTDYELTSSYLSTVTNKKYVDFTGLLNQEDAYASVYQYYDSTNENSVGSITGSSGLTASVSPVPFSLQAEVVFPNKENYRLLSYDIPQAKSSSICGFHTPADTTPTSTTLSWAPTAHDWGLQLYAVKQPGQYAEITSPDYLVRDAYFVVENTRTGDTLLTSDIISNVYDNQKWNLSLTLKPKNYPFSEGVLGASASLDGYELGLIGINYDSGARKNSFETSVDISYFSGSNTLASAKRIYAGAHRENFTGDVLSESDIKVGSVKFWTDYMSFADVDAQAREVDSHGVVRPFQNAYLFASSSVGTYVPRIQTLALDWDFAKVTGSNGSGRFSVPDASSGSIDDSYQGSLMSKINLRQHTARGDFFAASATPVRKGYVYSDKLLPPEYVSSVEMTKVLTQDEEVFGKYVKPASNYFAIEKSMYRGISNRILQLFASIDDFNNLIGEPVNKYRMNYKRMEKLREIFFRKVKNDIPDLQKYLDYYKWIDSAMGQMIEQLLPMSSRYAPNVRNIVESHSLERSKVQYQYPIIKRADPWGNNQGPVGNVGGSNTPLGLQGDPHSPVSHPSRRPRNPINDQEKGVNDLGGDIQQDARPPEPPPADPGAPGQTDPQIDPGAGIGGGGQNPNPGLDRPELGGPNYG
jgi:hypothetical protein